MTDETEHVLDADGAVAELLAHAEGDNARFGLGYSLDRSCGMIGPGELGLIWARSSVGKSTWLLNVLSRTNIVPTVVFNMEMTARRQFEWLTCMTRNLYVSAREVEELLKWPDDTRYPQLVEALREMKRYVPHLHFVNPGSPPTVPDFIRTCDAIWDKTGVRPLRVVIDHLTLMANARDYDGVGRTASALHTWAMNDAIAVMAVQQTGRGGNEKMRNDGHLPVTLSSGVYAGEHDADFIYGLYRPEKHPKFADIENRGGAEYERVRGITRLQLIKNRPFGEVLDLGVELEYDSHTRRLYERGETYIPSMEVDPA